jgi:hypothetical protein
MGYFCVSDRSRAIIHHIIALFFEMACDLQQFHDLYPVEQALFA